MKVERSDLLPCPFCGWHIVELCSDGDSQWMCMCDNCMAMASPNDTKEEAVASWQARSRYCVPPKRIHPPLYADESREDQYNDMQRVAGYNQAVADMICLLETNSP
jgi:hypothetical protein